MALLLQSRHSPSSLAICRLSRATFLAVSLRSGRCRLSFSYSCRLVSVVVSVRDSGKGWLVCWTGTGVLSKQSGCEGSRVSFSSFGFPSERLFLSVLLFALGAAFGSLPPRSGSRKVC